MTVDSCLIFLPRLVRRVSCSMLLALCVLCAYPLLLQAETGKGAGAKGAADTGGDRFITIDFDNVDIRLFIKYISELTGTNFIVDKQVQGNVTIISPTKITEAEAYQLFESVLEVNGFTTVPAGAITKIMPATRAPSQNLNILSHGEPSRPEDKIVTQIIPLHHSTPEEMKKVLAPLVSKTSVVIAHTQSGMLIVTETLSNIQKLLAIIESIDVPLSNEEVTVIPLTFASATVAATAINGIFQQGAGSKDGKTGATLKVVPYEPINSLILVASPTNVVRVKELVAMLDTEMKQNEGNIQVVYLQHATAKELATVLTALPGQQSSDPAKKGEIPSISKDVKIMPDIETNSLIITASRTEFKVLENVIRKLDIPRRMVYLEALIMEVDADATFDVGVRWMGGGTFDDGTGKAFAGFGGSAGYKLLDTIGYTSGVPATDKTPAVPANAFAGQGFTLGVLKQGIQIGGITFPDIAAVLKAYKTDSSVNVIATPQILTTDNKKAEISIGENIPYQTRVQESINNTPNTGGILNPITDTGSIGYANYEYKDVATKLTITPQINQADILRLEIATEVSKLKAGSDPNRPQTFKRTATTTVLVKDNNTIVIGGIIGQDDTEGEYKIPLFGDIPVLGWLFKEQSTKRKKTNMFIFITPRIIKNPGEMTSVTDLKADTLEKVLPETKELLANPLDNNKAMPLIDRGFEQMQKGNLAEARALLTQALELAPQNPYALFNLAALYEQEGDRQQAIRYYQVILDNASAQVATHISNTQAVDANILESCRANIARLQQQAATIEAPAQNP